MDTFEVCSRCGEPKPEKAYAVNRRSKSGRYRTCMACQWIIRRDRVVTPRKLARLQKQFLLAFGLRRCNACGQVKRPQAFNKNRAQSDGLAGECKTCDKARYMARPLAERNARIRDWMKRNPEAVLMSARIAASARRARIRNAFVEHVDPRVLLERDEGVCGICERPIEGAFDIDHIKPLVGGGEHSYANTRIAHPSCNRAKGREQVVLYAGAVSHRASGTVSQLVADGTLAAAAKED